MYEVTQLLKNTRESFAGLEKASRDLIGDLGKFSSWICKNRISNYLYYEDMLPHEVEWSSARA